MWRLQRSVYEGNLQCADVRCSTPPQQHTMQACAAPHNTARAACCHTQRGVCLQLPRRSTMRGDASPCAALTSLVTLSPSTALKRPELISLRGAAGLSCTMTVTLLPNSSWPSTSGRLTSGWRTSWAMRCGSSALAAPPLACFCRRSTGFALRCMLLHQHSFLCLCCGLAFLGLVRRPCVTRRHGISASSVTLTAVWRVQDAADVRLRARRPLDRCAAPARRPHRRQPRYAARTSCRRRLRGGRGSSCTAVSAASATARTARCSCEYTVAPLMFDEHLLNSLVTVGLEKMRPRGVLCDLPVWPLGQLCR